eukprot:6934578-Alexandrium_andersonii.AAC.1
MTAIRTARMTATSTSSRPTRTPTSTRAASPSPRQWTSLAGRACGRTGAARASSLGPVGGCRSPRLRAFAVPA